MKDSKITSPATYCKSSRQQEMGCIAIYTQKRQEQLIDYVVCQLLTVPELQTASLAVQTNFLSAHPRMSRIAGRRSHSTKNTSEARNITNWAQQVSRISNYRDKTSKSERNWNSRSKKIFEAQLRLPFTSNYLFLWSHAPSRSNHENSARYDSQGSWMRVHIVTFQ